MLTQRRVIKPEIVHPVVFGSGENWTLVDCGDPELAGELLAELREKGVDPQTIQTIIITHHDLDHMGGLSGFLDRYPEVRVLAHEEQAPYIRGEKRWLRLQAEDRAYLQTPPAQRIPSSRVRAQQYLYFLPGRVDGLLHGGETLPLGGGCRVVETPWHMPGHISLYLPAQKALLSGDALNCFDGVLGLNRQVDLCPEKTAEGLRALAALEVEAVYGYHGGLLRLEPGQFQKELERILREL